MSRLIQFRIFNYGVLDIPTYTCLFAPFSSRASYPLYAWHRKANTVTVLHSIVYFTAVDWNDLPHSVLILSLNVGLKKALINDVVK